mmetsp:Transcript_30434/g.89677  ORF Transcript_30434/g.89677 Transcript_30434/m.89677 type:complete len:203 (-) Transcript_30434:73-681(-)
MPASLPLTSTMTSPTAREPSLEHCPIANGCLTMPPHPRPRARLPSRCAAPPSCTAVMSSPLTATPRGPSSRESVAVTLFLSSSSSPSAARSAAAEKSSFTPPRDRFRLIAERAFGSSLSSLSSSTEKWSSGLPRLRRPVPPLDRRRGLGSASSSSSPSSPSSSRLRYSSSSSPPPPSPSSSISTSSRSDDVCTSLALSDIFT